MSDYTHEDFDAAMSNLANSNRLGLTSVQEDVCRSTIRTYVAILEAAAAAHHAAQLAEVRAKDEAIAKDALRECALDMGIRCNRCAVDDAGCDDRPCEEQIADYYYDRAEARS